MINLYNLDTNGTGVVQSIDNNYASKVRLAEMGLMPGVKLRLIKKSPFSGPIQIKINNYYLTLRKEDAELITLEIDK